MQAFIQGHVDHGCFTMSTIWSLDAFKWGRSNYGYEQGTKFQSVQIVVEC